MPQYPYGEPGVSVAWSHLGMRTGNSANEGDRLGSCWARGRIRYGMGVAAENLTFCRSFRTFPYLFFLLFSFVFCLLAPVSKRFYTSFRYSVEMDRVQSQYW